MEFVINNWYLFLALVVILALLFGGPVVQKIYGIKGVDCSQAVMLINHDKGVVLDVCEPKEFQSGHIPQAINIPLGKLAGRVKELDKFKKQPIIVSCRSGNRSLKGAATLRKNGFESVYTLSGGMLAWEKNNLPLEK